jgi:hypothetical protein
MVRVNICAQKTATNMLILCSESKSQCTADSGPVSQSDLASSPFWDSLPNANNCQTTYELSRHGASSLTRPQHHDSIEVEPRCSFQRT